MKFSYLRIVTGFMRFSFYTPNSIRLFFLSFLIPCLSFANVPGGGTGTGANVTVTDNGGTVVLANGIVSFTINKSSGNITNFTYNGTNLLAGGNGGGYFYFDGSGGPTLSNTVYTLTVNPANNGGNQAEVWLQSTASPMDMAVYYDLLRGQQGIYDTMILTHEAGYPDYPGAELRTNMYVGSVFDWVCVDPYRFRQMASPSDGTTTVAGAPPEVMQYTSGIYNGFTNCKYSYSSPLGQVDTWGWASTTTKYGLWQTLPSHEFEDGGPMHRELTEHLGNTLLDMFGGGHYGFGLTQDQPAGTFSSKTFGPAFIYANQYTGSASDPVSLKARVLWADAQAQAAAEQAAWPYPWFNPQPVAGATGTVYPQASGRATVSGTLAINDPYNSGTSPVSLWIGLAPVDGGVDFQQQYLTSQFWVRTGAGGAFTIPNILPGTYNLWAFGPGVVGTFEQANVTVTAGQTLSLGTLTWSPLRLGPTVWEIGTPDRNSNEFNNGEHQSTPYSGILPAYAGGPPYDVPATWAAFMAYPAQYPNGVSFVVGTSDPGTAWNYCQPTVPSGTTYAGSTSKIYFNLASAPSAAQTARLYIAFASAFSSACILTINGTVQTASVMGSTDGNYATIANSANGFYPPNVSFDSILRVGSQGAWGDAYLNFAGNKLKAGTNEIDIALRPTGGASLGEGFEYDYVRLEMTGYTTSGLPTPTKTNTPVAPTATSTGTATKTATPVPPTLTFTSTTTSTSTASRTATSTNTPVPPTATNTNSPVPPTATFTSTATATATRTNTALPPTPTNTSVPPTSTNTAIPPTSTWTNSPVPPTATRTNTAVPPTSTNTPVPPTFTPTNSPILPTSTNTAMPPTVTNTAVPLTATHTNTAVPPTSTYTQVPPTSTNTPVPPTATNTALPPTLTVTNTLVPPTSTNTVVPPTVTNTIVPPTATFTLAPPTSTNTVVPPTSTGTNTPVPPTATNTAALPTSTNTFIPPTATNTAIPPTNTRTQTPVPPSPTNTSIPPTSTSTTLPPTSTHTVIPPTATNSPVPPTSTTTSTPVPPTATLTNTPVPPTATPTRTPLPPTSTNTPVSPTPTFTAMPPTSTFTFTFVPTATPTPTTVVASTSLKVQLLSGVTSGTTNSPHPEIQVVNTGSGPLNLNNVTVKYWFNCDCTNQTLQAWVDWAGLMPAGSTATGDVQVTVPSTTLGGQTNYVLYTFTGNVTLQPGQAIQIQSRFNKSDWSNMTQANDWSFTPYTSYTDWTQVTGYLSGTLVWGQEPLAAPAALTVASAVSFPNPSGGNGTTLSIVLNGNQTGPTASLLDANHPLLRDPNAKITLSIYTMGMRLIWTQTLPGSVYGTTGEHEYYWDERARAGSKLANGVYILRVTVTSNGQTSSTLAKILILG